MSEQEYIVSLNKGVDYAAFNAEMIAATGAGAIPSRDVTVANARPASQRNTHYMLTDLEADVLRTDPRVYGVTLLPELDSSLGIGTRAVQVGDFTKTTLDRGDFLNWGMRRINEATNPYTDLTVTGGYNYTLDATGVDVVIMDSGIQADHPEFQDANGVSRVQQIDWTTASGIAGMPAQNANYYRDFDGHGTHVAGTVAGKTYGWAKNARIYSLKLSGLEGPGDSGTGTSTTYAFDCIKEWHLAKPVDPTTGVKRPTIVNMSWGYLRYYNTVTNLTYRGVLKTGTDIDTTAKRWAFGLPPVSGGVGGTFATNVRAPSADTDLQELIDAGVHVTIAAGNRSHKIDVVGGDDYSNFIAADTGSVEYQKGSSPYDEEAHIVGNIDSVEHVGGLEQKAVSSETGPGVSVYAPGTDIMSAMSTTNVFGATTLNNPYPANSDFLINNITGTSMASPQVAGMLALWLQINPNSTPAQALAHINTTAKTAQIYDTVSSVDYTDTRSLLGSNNRFTFNKFNSAVQLTLGTTAVSEEAPPAAAPSPTYAVTPAANNINEGSALVFNITTTNVADATTLYWSVTNAGDFGTSSGSFVINSNAGTFTVTPSADASTEGPETFTVSIRTDSVSGTVVATSSNITINDTSTTPAPAADYTINVVNNGASAYTLTGNDRNGSVSGDNQALAFNNGDVVDFVVNASGHPFYVKTAAVTGTGSTATGVTNNGAQIGTVQWTVGSSGTFYYICQFHSSMVGTITAS